MLRNLKAGEKMDAGAFVITLVRSDHRGGRLCFTDHAGRQLHNFDELRALVKAAVELANSLDKLEGG